MTNTRLLLFALLGLWGLQAMAAIDIKKVAGAYQVNFKDQPDGLMGWYFFEEGGYLRLLQTNGISCKGYYSLIDSASIGKQDIAMEILCDGNYLEAQFIQGLDPQTNFDQFTAELVVGRSPEYPVSFQRLAQLSDFQGHRYELYNADTGNHRFNLSFQENERLSYLDPSTPYCAGGEAKLYVDFDNEGQPHINLMLLIACYDRATMGHVIMDVDKIANHDHFVTNVRLNLETGAPIEIRGELRKVSDPNTSTEEENPFADVFRGGQLSR